MTTTSSFIIIIKLYVYREDTNNNNLLFKMKIIRRITLIVSNLKLYFFIKLFIYRKSIIKRTFTPSLTTITPDNRWKMLTESNIIYETFGINVVPAYMDIADIPTLHEASDEQDKQSKQQLLTFCHTLLRTRHQQLYMHIEHIEYATASTILYEVNNICMFLVYVCLFLSYKEILL